MDSQLENILAKIQNNKRTIELKLDINKNFVQDIYKADSNIINDSFLDTKLTLIDKNESIGQKSNQETINETEMTYILYKKKEVLDLPNILEKIIDLKNFYTYGVNKKLSILDSIYMILDPNYTLESEKSKNTIILETIKILLEKLDLTFKNNSYRLLKCKKPIMKECLDKNLLDNDMIKLYIADFFKVNIIILELSNNSFITCNRYNENQKTIILIKQFDYYLPLVNILGHIFESDIIDKIRDNFKQEEGFIEKNVQTTNLSTSTQEETQNNIENKLEDKNLITLEKIWKYNLKDLQEIAKKLDIDIFDVVNGKNKRKTKDKLYSDISIILN